MSALKKYAVNAAGEVYQLHPMDYGMRECEVFASTKSEATAQILKMARAALSYSPRIVIRDGAFLIVHHNGSEFIAEGGTVDRASSPLCISGHSTERDALENGGSFKYYASAEYRDCK